MAGREISKSKVTFCPATTHIWNVVSFKNNETHSKDYFTQYDFYDL